MFLVDLAETVDGLMMCMLLIQVSISTLNVAGDLEIVWEKFPYNPIH